MTVNKNLSLQFEGWRQEINGRLSLLLNGHKPNILYDPIQYVLEGGGKRIRPILLMMSCEAVGGDARQALDAAVAVELLHNFTLVHDDIMDQDDTRRGRPTVHRRWDANIALLSGDALLALAYRSLLKTPTSRIQDIAKVFTEGIVLVCEGQALDLEFETKSDVDLNAYLDMIGKKTARLLTTSSRIGGLIGGGNAAQVEALAGFSSNLGYAFQIQDDLLDITSDEITLGKTHASDVVQKKQTFLRIHASHHADAESRKKLHRLLSLPEILDVEIAEIRSLFAHIGSLEAAKAAVSGYLRCARETLDGAKSLRRRESLLNLLDYISKRVA